MCRWQWTRACRAAGVAALLIAAAGCASQRAAGRGETAAKSNNWDAAVYHYLEALASEPDNVEYRMELARARQRAAQEHFKRGQALRKLGRLSVARDEMKMAVQLDPTQQFAEQQLAQLEAELKVLEQPGGEATLAEMKRKAADAKVKPPILDPRSKEPITLNFPTPKPVKEIYEAMGKAYGFNVLFDPKLKDDKITVELNDVTSERALEIVMQAAGHFYKVLDEHTIIVIEESPQNRRDYEDLVIKTFFLSNADVKEVDKLLRSLIEARRLSTNEQLNSVTLRDSADKVAIAEKLIDINDKAKAEVLIDVELLLIATTKDSDIGTKLSTYSFGLGIDLDAINAEPPADGSLYLDEVDQISREHLFVNIPSLLINLIKSSGDAEVLAQPQLRITEGEKATLHIGDRVPIPVTSFNTQYQGGGGGIIPVTSFQYQDVGIKIDVEPRVHHNQEVTLKLTLEVSNLGESVAVGPSQTAVSIGTRTITTVIRLRSGESSLLAGLFRRDRSAGETKIPFLGDLPVLGRLFRDEKKNLKTTDLVMTLTPHILRFPDIREQDLAPLWVGTEARVSYFGSSSPRLQSGRAPTGPFDQPEEQPEEPAEEKEREEQEPRVPKPFPRPNDRSGTTPYGLRQPPAPRGTPLVPGQEQGLESEVDQPVDLTAPLGQEKALVEGTTPPVVITVEPLVLSLKPEQDGAIRVLASGGAGMYRLPLGLSFDASKARVVTVEPAGGVTIVDQHVDAEMGWLSLDVVVSQPSSVPQPLATVHMHATTPGPCPLSVTVGGARSGDGSLIPASGADGMLVVVDEEKVAGGP